MILAIDTSDIIKTKLYLFNESFLLVKKTEFKGKNNLSEQLLLKVDIFLNTLSVDKRDLTSIMVNRGPGSYTGLRIGISTANFIAYSLNIPIISLEGDIDKFVSNANEKQKKQDKIFSAPVVPFYKMPPHITKSKSCLN